MCSWPSVAQLVRRRNEVAVAGKRAGGALNITARCATVSWPEHLLLLLLLLLLSGAHIEIGHLPQHSPAALILIFSMTLD